MASVDTPPPDALLERAMEELEALPPGAGEPELDAVAARLSLDRRELDRLRQALLALGSLGSAEEPPAPTSRELGGCRLIAPISRGGQGSVWRAWHPGLAREVAVKVLRTDKGHPQPHLARRFQTEALTLARLRHPRVVAIHDAGVGPEGELFLVLDLVQGTTLAELGDRVPSHRRLAELGVELAGALEAAHGLGILHRDVKPGNVLLDERGDPVLVDFGLALDLETPRLTLSGVAVGTRGFASPEQAHGFGALDARTDVFGLGATLLSVARVEADAPLPPGLQAILERATRPDPAARYPSARALAEDLGRWLRGESIEVERGGSWPVRVGRRLARPRTLAPLLALVLLGTAAIGASLQASRRARWRSEAAGLRERLLVERDPFRAARLGLPAPRRERFDQARAALAELAARASDEELGADGAHLAALVEVEAALASGSAEAAEAAARDPLLRVRPGPERTLLAALLELAAGRAREAEAMLSDLRATRADPRFELELETARAAAAAALGRPEEALERLRAARPRAAALGLEQPLLAREAAALAVARRRAEGGADPAFLSSLAALVPHLPEGELGPLAVAAARGTLAAGGPDPQEALLALEKLAEAVEARGLRLLSGPELTRACERAASLHHEAGRLEAAAAASARALRLDRDARLPAALRMTFEDLGRDALVARDARAYLRASHLRVAAGMTEDAIQVRAAMRRLGAADIAPELRRMKEESPGWAARLLAASMWAHAGEEVGDADDALADLESVVSDPRVPVHLRGRAAWLLGTYLTRARRWAEALPHVEQALGLGHEQPDECHAAAVECLLGLGRVAEARARALEVTARGDDRAARTLRGGDALYEGRPHIDPLRADSRDAPAPLRHRRTLVMLFSVHGQPEEVARLAGELSALRGGADLAAAAGVGLSLEQGELTAARAAFERIDPVERRGPWVAEVLDAIHRGLEARGRTAEAEALAGWLAP